jgi:hypothetical protein
VIITDPDRFAVLGMDIRLTCVPSNANMTVMWLMSSAVGKPPQHMRTDNPLFVNNFYPSVDAGPYYCSFITVAGVYVSAPVVVVNGTNPGRVIREFERERTGIWIEGEEGNRAMEGEEGEGEQGYI